MKDITEFECESCSNERTDKINLARFFAKLDEAFSRGDLASAGRLIDYWERDARTIGDENGLLYVLNEQTGYFRRTGEKEKGLAAVNEALELTEKNLLKRYMEKYKSPVELENALSISRATLNRKIKKYGLRQCCKVNYANWIMLFDKHSFFVVLINLHNSNKNLRIK